MAPKRNAGPEKKPGPIRQKLDAFFSNNRNMYILTAIAVAIAIAAHAMSAAEPARKIPAMEYTEFVQRLESGEVDRISYSRTEEFMTVYLFDENSKNMPVDEREQYEYPEDRIFKVKYPGGETFREICLSYGADPVMRDGESPISMMFDIISITVYIALGIFVLRMMATGPLGMSGSNKKELMKTSDVRFSDVIGQDEVIDDLKLVVELMRHPEKGGAIGARVPKGLLLQGPPGTGKTMLAKAVAGEAGVPFIQQAGSSFIEMYVGLGAKRVRDVFKLARKNAPCVVFIDEIDAIGGKRGSSKGTSENEQTINAMLEQMDGFTARDGVFVIAATNRAEDLDEALIRPGRFDRQVTVNPPADWHVREKMFAHYLDRLSLAPGLDVENLAKQTPGFTGADIAAVCNEAGMVAVMAGKDAVDMPCIEEAIDKKVFKGSRSRREQYEKDRRVVAYHEAGHAVMTWLLGEPISRASIQATTNGVGGAVFGSDRESQFMTGEDFRKRVMIAYAGRASEEIKFGDATTGASSDITQATGLLKQYVERLGFDDEAGILDLNLLAKDRLVSAADTIKSLRRISKELYADCKKLLKDGYRYVDVLAECLLAEESLAGPRIERVLSAVRDQTENA